MEYSEQIIDILLDNMKDQSSFLTSTSRKTLLDMTTTHLSTIVKCAIKVFDELINNPSNNDLIKSWIEKYVLLISDIISKAIKSKCEFTQLEPLLNFILEKIKAIVKVTNIQSNEVTNNQNELNKQQKVTLITKLLVKIGYSDLGKIILSCLSLFNVGETPNKLIVDILLMIVNEFNNKALYSFSEIISRLLPILSTIKEDNMRILYSCLFSSICEGIISSIETKTASNEAEIGIHLNSINPLIRTIYDLINTQWVKESKDNKDKTQILISCLLMGSIIQTNDFNLIQIFINGVNQRKESLSDTLLLLSAFRKYLDFKKSTIEAKDLDGMISGILAAVFPLVTNPQISPNVKEFNPELNKIKSEIMQIIKLLFSERTVNYLILKSESSSNGEKLSSIYTIKTLFLSCDEVYSVDLILSSISKALHEKDPELKYALVELIYVLIKKKIIKDLSFSNKFIAYLIKESSLPCNDKELCDNPTYPFATSQRNIKERSEVVLSEILLSSHSMFFPLLYDLLLDEKFNDATPLITKLILSSEERFDNKISMNHKLFIRLLEINQVALLKALLPLISADFSSLSGDFSIEKIINSITDKKFFEDSLSFMLDLIKTNKKTSIMKLLGFFICTQKDKTSDLLDSLFNIVYPEYRNSSVDANCNESKPDKEIKLALAGVFGLIARSDLDTALDKITAIFKSTIKYNKPSGISSFFATVKEPVLNDEIKSQLVLCLGKCALSTKPDLLPSRLSSYFFSQIDPCFTIETLMMKESCVIAYNDIFTSLEKLSSSYLGNELYLLTNREYYLTQMMDLYKKSSKPMFKSKILLTISSLIQLDPPLQYETLKEVISMAFGLIKEVYDDETIAAFTAVLKSSLVHENYQTGDKEIITNWDLFLYLLNELSLSKEERALGFLECLFNSKKTIKFINNKERNSWILSLIELISLNDTININLPLIRLLTAVNIFEISAESADDVKVECISRAVTQLNDEDILYFINNLIVQTENSLAVEITKAVLLGKSSLVSKMNTLANHICICSDSKNISHLLPLIDIITDIDIDVFLNLCLDSTTPLPFCANLNIAIQRVSKNQTKLKKIFSRITDIINNEPPGVENIPNHEVSSSTLILGTILYDINDKSSKLFEMIQKFFPQLLSTLLLRVGSMHSINYTHGAFATKEEDPRNQTIWTLQNLLKFSSFEIAIDDMHKRLMNCREYDEGIYELMLIVCSKLSFEHQVIMFDFMKDFLERQWVGQRVIVITCIAQIIYNMKFDKHKEYIDQMVIELIKAMSDSEDLCRKMAIRGLGNLTKLYLDACALASKEEDKSILKKAILDEAYDNSLKYIIDKIGDTSDCVIVESLKILSYMIEYLSTKVLIPFMTLLLSRLRPCFDNNNTDIRQYGFILFNSIILLLETELDTKLTEIIKDQVKTNLVSLLLHITDEAHSVKRNTIKCLNSSLRLVYSLEREVKESETDTYETLIKDLIDLISEDQLSFHILNSINHSKSTQEKIRGNSCILTGVLYSVNNEKINKEKVLSSYVDLLKDYSAFVKQQAVYSLKFVIELTKEA